MIDIVWGSLIAQQVKNPPVMQETRRYCLEKNIFPSSKYISLSSWPDIWRTRDQVKVLQRQRQHMMVNGVPTPHFLCNWLQRPKATHSGQWRAPLPVWLMIRISFCLCNVASILGCFVWPSAYSYSPVFFLFFSSFFTVTIYDAFNVVN